jgi:ELWxxDGT repeat protein
MNAFKIQLISLLFLFQCNLFAQITTLPYMIKDIRSGSVSSNPYSFLEYNGELLFLADDGSSGTELWHTDGTTGGTNLIKDIYAGTTSFDSK